MMIAPTPPSSRMNLRSTPEKSAVRVGTSSGLSVGALIGLCVLLAAFFGSDIPGWAWLFHMWVTKPDSSHGILVPAFSAWLLWSRRDQMDWSAPTTWTAIVLGCILIVAGIAIRCAGIYTRTISMEAVSILPCIWGVIFVCGGWSAARWAWPSAAFLIFMIPIPGGVGGLLASKLQSIATICTTYFLQTIGIPAISEGNVIWLTEKPIGVAEACSGIRMLTTFFALSAAVSLVIERPLWEKFLIIASAPAIAILANVLRISATAIAFEFGSEKMAELIFHDLAGWLMMPLGLLLLWAELFVLLKLFEKVEQQDFSSGSITG